MTARLLLLGIVLGTLASVASGQTFTPQSPAGLGVTFTTEKAGGSRLLVFGEVRNNNSASAQHVVLVAEGLDQDGRVVSRAKGYVLGVVPSRGSASFEIRMLAGGSEKRYRVQIESFEFQVGGN
jgi:hypothetical protein